MVIGLMSTFAVNLLSQPPGRPPREEGRPPEGRDMPPPPPNPLIEALDTDHDGVISTEELKNAVQSLKKLDKNKDGKLTEEEMRPEGGPGRPPGPDGGPGGRPGPGREGPGGRGGPGGAGRGEPGLLPPFAREQLKLSDQQEKQIADLEKDARDKLMRILTPEQRKQMEELRARGPGGPPGDRGGPGRPPEGGERPTRPMRPK